MSWVAIWAADCNLGCDFRCGLRVAICDLGCFWAIWAAAAVEVAPAPHSEQLLLLLLLGGPELAPSGAAPSAALSPSGASPGAALSPSGASPRAAVSIGSLLGPLSLPMGPLSGKMRERSPRGAESGDPQAGWRRRWLSTRGAVQASTT